MGVSSQPGRNIREKQAEVRVIKERKKNLRLLNKILGRRSTLSDAKRSFLESHYV